MLTVKATINTIENIVTTLDRIGFSSPVSGKIFRTFIRTENLNRHCKSLAVLIIPFVASRHSGLFLERRHWKEDAMIQTRRIAIFPDSHQHDGSGGTDKTEAGNQ
jgi:hypothetical protein